MMDELNNPRSSTKQSISDIVKHSANPFDKLNLINQNSQALCVKLYEKTGYRPTDEEIRSIAILNQLNSAEMFEFVDRFNQGISTFMLGIPRYVNPFMTRVMDLLRPRSFDELIRTLCICYGSNTWFDNAEILVADGKADINTLITCCEDVYERLSSTGMDDNMALDISESISKGRLYNGTMRSEQYEALMYIGLPEWYIWSLRKIKMLILLPQVEEYAVVDLKILYYKLHNPKVFYSVVLSSFAPDKIRELFNKGEDGFYQLEQEILTNEELTSEEYHYYLVWIEMRKRLNDFEMEE